MGNELVVIEEPQLPAKWNYEDSVKKVSAYIYKWKTLTTEIARELYIAREKLRNPGARSDLGTKIPELRTWKSYCENIGSSRQVVNRWLNRWFPQKMIRSETPKLPSEQYGVIYADPPWRYDFSKDNADSIETHYPTMELKEIKELAIPTVKNAVLYLWATAPKLREALEVLVAWGFDYKTHLAWDKKWIGMGYWFRGQHELLLVGVKGNVPPPPETERVSSVLSEKRKQHSRKPAIIYKWIENWHPTAKKIELFARGKRKGWTVWGNEV